MLNRISLCVGMALTLASSIGSAQEAVRCVGPVTEVWAHDARYAAFHKELESRLRDVPTLEDFMQGENWVSVYSSTSRLVHRFVKARVPKEVAIATGDIVEVTVADNLRVPSYGQTSVVARVLCAKSDSENFDACSRRTEQGLWAANGEKLPPTKR